MNGIEHEQELRAALHQAVQDLPPQSDRLAPVLRQYRRTRRLRAGGTALAGMLVLSVGGLAADELGQHDRSARDGQLAGPVASQDAPRTTAHVAAGADQDVVLVEFAPGSPASTSDLPLVRCLPYKAAGGASVQSVQALDRHAWVLTGVDADLSAEIRACLGRIPGTTVSVTADEASARALHAQASELPDQRPVTDLEQARARFNPDHDPSTVITDNGDGTYQVVRTDR